MDEKFYIEVACKQKNHSDARVCGDVFFSRRIKEEGRIIAVLSDGMGHGIKANILATLTSTLALNLAQEHKSVEAMAATIMSALPVDSVKEMNYSTFTIADIDVEGEVRILEYENPKTLFRKTGFRVRRRTAFKQQVRPPVHGLHGHEVMPFHVWEQRFHTEDAQ